MLKNYILNIILIGAVFVLLNLSACRTSKIPLSLKNKVSENIKRYDIELNEQLISYFSDIAFGSEYRATNNVLITWNKPVRIKIIGDYSQSDSLVVVQTIKELNAILPTTHLLLVSDEHNIIMYFTNREGFKKNAPEYAWTNAGYFSISWTPKEKHVIAGKILIGTELSAERAEHVIREEITQILGLMNDSYAHSESIFYQGNSEKRGYAAVDKEVLRLWDALKPASGYEKGAVEKLLLEMLKAD